jgi:hypothetical protein
MTVQYEQFETKVRESLPQGAVLPNPGGGTSTVLRYTGSSIVYVRGKSSFSVGLQSLYEAFGQFTGESVSTSDLKEYAPRVFDSTHSGHNCNGTFLFMVLKRIGVIDDIRGTGKRGDPFWTTIPAHALCFGSARDTSLYWQTVR